MTERSSGSDSGIVLMLVIWVIAILMTVVLALSMIARSRTLQAVSFGDQAKERFLAEAGVQRAIMELCYASRHGIQNGVDETENAWRQDGSAYGRRLGGGRFRVRITGETGKIDINMAPEALILNLVQELGVGHRRAEVIADSIMDWKDPTGFSRPHGAGNDYYESLPHPYKIKGANFEVLEELLLVRGITPELLFGTGKKKGLVDFLTVNSRSQLINVNFAPRQVLLSIPGMSPAIADWIIGFRKRQKISTPQALQGLLGPTYGLLGRFLSAGDGDVFTIYSVGRLHGLKGGYPIRAAVLMNFADDSCKYLYYKSPAYRD